jgi:ABC-type amino acid transport substrate-binding protein
VENGEADAGIAAISITSEREEVLDFSHPYYQSGLQVMIASGSRTHVFNVLANILSSRVLPVLGIMVLFVILTGHLVWLAERRGNPDFPKAYLPGVWAGIWWASVTVTTVGYGDVKVRRVLGRILGIVWMFFGLFLLAGFTATVTAELTVSRFTTTIQNVEDLRRYRVATVEGTTSAQYLAEQHIPYIGTDKIESAYAMLERGEVDGVVYDAPVLAHYASQDDEGQFSLVGKPFKEEDYGIALAPDSPYEEAINQALLELAENGTYDELHRTWFGAEE